MSDSHYEPIIDAEGEFCGFVQLPGPGPGWPLTLTVGTAWRCGACGKPGTRMLLPGQPGRLVHTCQLPGKPARTLLVDPFDSPSAAVLRPGLYRHYRSRYIETGDPVWLAGMLDHVGPETEPPPEPSLPTESTRGSARLAALTTTIATIMFLACIAWMLLRGFGVL